jgi:hypothetical protein
MKTQNTYLGHIQYYKHINIRRAFEGRRQVLS